MRIQWDPNRVNRTVENISVERLNKAAKVLRATVKRRLAAEIGKGKETGINRPVYLTGPYAGSSWTAREAGSMMNSVRLTRKKTRVKKALSKKRSVWLRVGHYEVFYAEIFEFYRPFLRPALAEAEPMMNTMLGIEGGSFDMELESYNTRW